MRAVVVTLVLVVVVVLLGLAIGRRLDHDEPVRVETRAPTTTTVWPTERVPDLGAGFDRLVAAMRPKPKPQAKQRTAPSSAAGHPCGGDLPPCWVMLRESGGDIHAYNPTGCGGRGCRGKWQCDPHTCSGTGSEEQQDAEARALWDHGRGCAHWNACGAAA